MAPRSFVDLTSDVVSDETSESTFAPVFVACACLIAISVSLLVCLRSDTPKPPRNAYQAKPRPSGSIPPTLPPGNAPRPGTGLSPYPGQQPGAQMTPPGRYPGFHQDAATQPSPVLSAHQQREPSYPIHSQNAPHQHYPAQPVRSSRGQEQQHVPGVPGAMTFTPAKNLPPQPSYKRVSNNSQITAPGRYPDDQDGVGSPPSGRSQETALASLRSQGPSLVQSQGKNEVVQSNSRKADIYAVDKSVAATVALLHDVCDRMGGKIQRDCTLHQESIRTGCHAAMAEVVTRFGTDITVLFYPDKHDKDKQLKISDKAALKDFIAAVVDECGEGVYKDGDVSVWLPGHVFVEHCTTLPDALDRCGTSLVKLHEIFTICEHLTRLLQAQHCRAFVVRDLSAGNIVRTTVGTTRRWTLLDHCSQCRMGKRTERVAARCTPPELALARLNDHAVTIDAPYDLWQLGMLMYEISTGEVYWGESTTDAEVLHVLASPTLPLPHEERPSTIDFVQRLLSKLLTRTAEARLSADGLKRELDREQGTGNLVGTVNPGLVKTEKPRELKA